MTATMSRAALEALPPWARADALRGHRLVDVPSAPRRVGSGEMSRKKFDSLPLIEKRASLAAGTKIVDAGEGPTE